MAQLFPKSANRLPLITLVAGGVLTVLVIAGIWYYFSPKFTDVGYAPVQPVPYSHRLHGGELGMDCRYCHSNVEVAAHANVPPTQTCMNCHTQIQANSPKLLTVRESWSTGEPVEWVRVHKLADYAQFSHSAHMRAGVGCETCHGRVDQMEVVTQKQPLSMSWCIECHMAPENYLRPPELVTQMGFDEARPADQREINLVRIQEEGIVPPTNCSACHY